MATPLSDEIRALIAYANETTEADDTKLGDCVKTLCDGYGQGGMQVSELGYNGHVNASQLAAQGWTQAQINRLVSKIWWNEDEDDWYNSHLDRFYHITTGAKPPTDAIAFTYDVASVGRLDYFARYSYNLCYADITDVQSWGVWWALQIFGNCRNLRVCILNPASMQTAISSLSSSFSGCANLEYLKIGEGVRLADDVDLSGIFNGCNALRIIDWHSNSFNATSMNNAFMYCSRLTEIDFESMGCIVIPSTANQAFSYCYSLRKIIGVVDLTSCNTLAFVNELHRLEEARFKGIKVATNLSASPLSHDSLVYLLTNLQTVSNLTLTLGANNLAKLTDTEKALATSKGWILA